MYKKLSRSLFTMPLTNKSKIDKILNQSIRVNSYFIKSRLIPHLYRKCTSSSTPFDTKAMNIFKNNKFKTNHSQSPSSNSSNGNGNKNTKNNIYSSFSIKSLIHKYGPSAFITYQLISTTSLCLWFIAVHYGMDTDEATKTLNKWKNNLLKFISKDSNYEELNENKPQPTNRKAMDDSKDIAASFERGHDEHKSDIRKSASPANSTLEIYDWQAFTTEFVVAFTFHKLLLPLRIGLTALWTPRMSKFIRRKKLDFWVNKKSI